MPVTVRDFAVRDASRRMLRVLSRFGRESVAEAVDKVGADVIAQYRKHIDSGRSPEGRFARLSPAYKAWKARFYSERPILYLTGSMYRSFRAVTRWVSATRLRLSVGATGNDAKGVSNAVKAQAHQDGAPRSGRAAAVRKGRKGRAKVAVGGLPARPFATLPAKFLDQSFARAAKTVLQKRRP